MLFNSIDFAIFLPIVFLLYWFVFNKNIKTQNIFILGASYVFYGWWDWRFLSLMLFSTLTDYLISILLNNNYSFSIRKGLLWTSILINLGLLGLFKYYNYFIENLCSAFSFFGYEIPAQSLNIILPIGISFYTFQTMSYTIDVYYKKITPIFDLISFSAYVSFFPQLVAGPIERASNLLPQFSKSRKFDYASGVDGMRQILWGLFKKMVIADNCGVYVDIIYGDISLYSGSTLFFASMLFAFQIYCDFSGYSDIAIGTARLFGFNLMRNFAFPYFSRDIAEFWRRWHISLTTWFRDYLYIPLGGSKGNDVIRLRNVFIIFTISGLWHGANWTFIFWGLLNAIYFIPLMLTKRNRVNVNDIERSKYIPSLKDALKIIFTFLLIVSTWIFFRSDTLSTAFKIYSKVFSISFFTIPHGLPLFTVSLLTLLIVIEWFQRHNLHGLTFHEVFGFKAKVLRWSVYILFLFMIIFFKRGTTEFIYFQF